METIILSLGGSLIVPEKIDVGYLKLFRELILKYATLDKKFVIVTGGGKICRRYQNAAETVSNISDEEADWIGVAATKLNAALVKGIFEDLAYEEVITNPNTKIKTDKKIIVASGWKPGFSSDMDAVLLAKNLGAKTVINLTNIDYVYNKDPKKYEDAEKIERISWKDFRNIVGEEWDPGLNVPFDPVASKEAAEAGLKVIITNGRDLRNLEKIFEGKKSEGTIIE